MPYKDVEQRKQYIKDWKKQRSIERGTYGKRGKHQHTVYTEEEFLEKEKERNVKYRKWQKQYFEINQEKRMLYSARRRAREKGLPFTIVESDIKIPKTCPYLGVELVVTAPRGTDRSKVCSLDRIIPELGYTPSNIEVISQLANTMKQAATPEQLVMFAKTILQRYG